ncbi:MAG: pyrimidine-nucleoside phosphorylase [Chloroflexi bacterium]|jgi:pyrimidine-nucleoside phosphorylase|nr:pyrimidine-nucleoside phosphorylase [Chloroflexota bacterium]MBT3668855.1 pyrimidine-nucleoside phosphorylase [Chloroflexota bacterium]MBT4002760.1 pyrimidine-nucleoside phosphorylase [Chloroflexota bacterium]MBT4306569.1 pyrimidine-nucleoside phosphorylase [Chloroflexota bacterium]MBT4533953.1 pyrimidine-nucleoside phosphorylase [Chloroflexota bacterium]
MRIVDIIIKKRDKQELSSEEINFFIDEFAKGNVPDYQASAWAMAVLLNGMTPRETTTLTMAMVNSGEIIDLSDAVEIAVDKHSTGGVGDKTTLVVEPVVAACGLPVGKMSGRGLGFSGGTLDKMESVPGFRTDLDTEEFLKQLNEIGLVLTGQTGDLAPADGKLYALRDVTGTVPSMPLIASSIMSKKIAAGAHRIVLDVKLGLGAFMETEEEARVLAEIMVKIGDLAGRKTVALLSDMNQPLGVAVGNSLEVIEAIDTLKGKGPEDFYLHCLEVAAHMLHLGGKADSPKSAEKMVAQAIQDGSGLEMFRKLVIAQEGDVSYIDNPEKFLKANFIEEVLAPEEGYIKEINARKVGELSVELGAGRTKKTDPVDHAVGLMIHRNVGDYVKKGDLLATIHANQEEMVKYSREILLDTHKFSDAEVEPIPLFYGVID